MELIAPTFLLLAYMVLYALAMPLPAATLSATTNMISARDAAVLDPAGFASLVGGRFSKEITALARERCGADLCG